MPPKKPPPGNPQWVEWVEDLAHTKQQEGSKAAFSYKKAATSLRNHPLPMQHPNDALKLSGVGPELVKYLIRKMKDAGNDIGTAVSPQAISKKKKVTEGARKRKVADTSTSDEEAREAERLEIERILNSKEPTNQRQAQNGFYGAGHPLNGGGSLHCAGERLGSPSPPPPPVKKKKTSQRPYVPKKGSGAYSILLALYKESSYEDQTKWVLKTDIIKQAQPHCDTPFTVASVARGSTHESRAGNYTAWSSISTLIQKDLVRDKNSRPQFYSLRSEGYALAESLAEAAGISLHVRIPTSSSSDGQAPYRPSSNGTFTNGIGYSSAAGAGPGPKTSAARGKPIYIDDEDDDEDEENHYVATAPLPHSSASRADVIASSSSADEESLQLKPACRESLRMAQLQGHPSSSGAVDPAPLRIARPLPPMKEKPAFQAQAGVLDGRKAAQGGYGLVRIEPEKQMNLGVDGPFGYYYLDEDDNRVKSRKDAERGQEESHPFATTYRIEYRTCQDLHHMSRSVIRPSTLYRAIPLTGGSTKSGYLKERQAASECPGFIDLLTTSTADGSSGSKAPSAAKKGASLDSLMKKGSYKPTEKKDKQAMYAPPPGFGANLSSEQDYPLHRSSSETYDLSVSSKPAVLVASPSTSFVGSLSSRPASATASKPTSSKSGSITNVVAVPSFLPARALSQQPPAPHPQPLASVAPLVRTTSTQNPLMTSYDAVPSNLTINRHPLDPVRDVESSNFVYDPFEPIILKAGTFQIYLVCDHREISDKWRGQRTEVFDLLAAKGLRVERRGLPLGDFIWIAKRKGTYGADDQDVVLNAILERKRLDDLCGSVRDGRYVGQKVRMKESAITDRTYLIEKFNAEASYKDFGKAIWTCKSQLQVIDGFNVHETSNMSETLNYLIKRTEIMIELYENKDLYVIPDHIINRPTYLALQKHLRTHQPTRTFLTTYASFNVLNDNSATKLSQIWATQIQRVSGLSAEKAVQFTERWPTLYQFFVEARAHKATVDAENAMLDLEDACDLAVGFKLKKIKRRKPEDFIVDSLPATDSTRGIKGKLGSKIYQLFMESGHYSE